MLLIPGEPIVVLSRDPGGGPAVPHASGAPAIAAWVAAGLGARTSFLGAVGDDEFGALIRGTLTGAGLDPATIITKPGLPTATAYVRYHLDGSRSFDFQVAGSAATALTPADLDRVAEPATWVHVSGSAVLFGGTLADAVIAAVQRARAAGATVSIDPNLRAELDDPARRAVLRDLCAHADVLFPSDDELDALGLDEDQLVAGGTVVCRTMAADGARIRGDGVDLSVPAIAPAHAVVDPDGAGDTFAGAVIAGRLAGLGWADAAHAAAGVVARAIAVPGPMSVPLTPADLS